MRRTLPRFFVGRADAQNAGHPPDVGDLSPAHIVDSFFIGSRHLDEREWIVAVDILGGLAVPARFTTRHPSRIGAERTGLQ